MTETISRIDNALAFLRENNCRRDNGVWMTADNLPLRSDPVESVKLLRRAQLIREIAERKESGRGFTR